MSTNQTLAFARSVEKKYGTSYYLATLFLPEHIRNAVFILYAFVRIPDEYVDNPEKNTDPKEKIRAWQNEWNTTYHTGIGAEPLLEATREVFMTYSIPFELSIKFTDAMLQDLVKARYQTYNELKEYMHGSAEVVGLMLTYIFGYTNGSAFIYAAKLGEAMQLTNFLRDIREDYDERGRIYLPQEDMNLHGVTEATLRTRTVSPEFINLMNYEIKRARTLFKEADIGILMLSPKTQFAVRLASRLYEKILDKIEDQKYDVFTNRARSNLLNKLIIITKTYVKY